MRSSAPRFAAVTCLFAMAAAPARALAPNDHALDLPAAASIGSSVTIRMTGPADTLGLFMASFGDGPFDSCFGAICLDFPLILAQPFLLDAGGHASFDVLIPGDPDLVDVTIHTQFLTARPLAGLSNPASIELEDELFAGDLYTYNELSWGTECREGYENDAGCFLDEWFDTAFPKGLTIGEQQGEDDDLFAIHFTGIDALRVFLPANDGEPDHIRKNETDPTTTEAGDIIGQVAAAKLNVELDDLGAFDALKNRPDLKLGDLIVVANVNPDLFGMTVREVIEVSDLALSGALGEGDMDINYDGKPDATLKDLADALRAINKDFEDGGIHRGTTDVK